MCACVCKSFSCIWPFATPWTVAHQAPLSTGFSTQEYWSPGDLPNPGSNPHLLYLLCLQEDSLPLVPHGKPYIYVHN